MLGSLSQSLMAAHTALEYLTVDQAYADLRAWMRVYEDHLIQLYALGAEVNTTPPFDPCVPVTVLPAFSRKGGEQQGESSWMAPRLLVVLGDDDMRVDLAALRAASRAGGFTWQRLVTPTAEMLSRELARARRVNKPYTWLHVAAHADQEGVRLADGVVDGVWLSGQLSDVEVLLLAACRCDWVADALGVVPWVVSFAEEIETHDAAHFAGAFWTAMGLHRRADDAVEAALDAVSPEVAEFVRRHW